MRWKSWPGQGGFLFGRFSIADCMYAPVVSRFRTYGIALSPALQAYSDRIWARCPQWPTGAKRPKPKSMQVSRRKVFNAVDTVVSRWSQGACLFRKYRARSAKKDLQETVRQ